ncbi:LmeA family phospholipid-binding protein [Leptolyngbya sp. AN02str]|uniref:LmeA family phospholipid-binding protein n=1 Tax=Leptolyngbya sp. AN02str TaxID=3423363 RepID=UPI003D322D26
MTSDNADLGEKALSKAAEMGITNQLDKVEELDVDIRANPSKLVQGEVESVAIAGKGMVMKQQLRMESLDLKTDAVAINPLRAVLGDIQLTHPTNADAQVVLTEGDLNRAIASDFLQEKLKDLKLKTADQVYTVVVNRASIHLLEDGTVFIDAKCLIQETNEEKKLTVTVVPKLIEDEHKIGMEVLSAEGEGLTTEFIAAVIDAIAMLLDLRNFQVPGMSFQLRKFEVTKGKLTLHAQTEITQLPNAEQ